MDVGSYLKKVRLCRKISIRKLSEKSGISTSEISRIESGHRQNPSPMSLTSLAGALGLPVSEVMYMAGYLDERDPYLQGIDSVDQELIPLIHQVCTTGTGEQILTLKQFLCFMVHNTVVAN